MPAPGRSHRQGISLLELGEMFPTEESARRWFEAQRWPDGVRCPRCDTVLVSQVPNARPAPWHCRPCRRYFSVRTGTVMAQSKIPLRKWAFAIYLCATSLKGVSSMKLHRDLKITQKAAWFLAHRIRAALAADGHLFDGPVEADETYIGGREKNKHASRKQRAGRGPVGKAVVAGVLDRATGQLSAAVVPDTTGTTLRGFVRQHTAPGAMVYTDDATAYRGLPNHRMVRHSVSQWVDGQAHINGLESLWSLLKRGYHGTFHHMSPKHLQRYVDEFATRQGMRELDTARLMGEVAARMAGRRLTYASLTAGGPAYPPRR